MARRPDQQRKAMFARMRAAMGRVSPKNRREMARSAVTAGIGAGVVLGGVALMRRGAIPGGGRLALAGGALGAAAGGNLYEDVKRALAQAKESGKDRAAGALARGHAVKRHMGEAARTMGGRAAEKGTESVINWAGIAAEDILRRRIHESTARLEGNLARLAGSTRRVATERALGRIQAGREHVAAALSQPLSHDEVKAFREAQQEIVNRLKLLERRSELAKRVRSEERSASEMLRNIVRAKGKDLRAKSGVFDEDDMAAVRRAFPKLTPKDLVNIEERTRDEMRRSGR